MANCPDIAPLARAIASLQRVFEDFSVTHRASETERARDFEARAAAARRLLEEKRENARLADETLAADREAFEAEKVALDNTFRFAKQKVKLDVGGKPFSTTISTLCAVPGSLLAAMFSGRYEMHADADGSFFVDRDGNLFHHILNYLRAPAQFQPPGDRTTRHALWKEAEYFKIYELWGVLFPGQPQPSRRALAPVQVTLTSAQGSTSTSISASSGSIHPPPTISTTTPAATAAAAAAAVAAATTPSSLPHHPSSHPTPTNASAPEVAAAALASARVAAIMAGEGDRPYPRFTGSPVVVPRAGPGMLDDTYESDGGSMHGGIEVAEDALGLAPLQCGHGEEVGRPPSELPPVFSSAGITPDPLPPFADTPAEHSATSTSTSAAAAAAAAETGSGVTVALQRSPFAISATLQPLTSTPSRPFDFRPDTDTSGNDRYGVGSAAANTLSSTTLPSAGEASHHQPPPTHHTLSATHHQGSPTHHTTPSLALPPLDTADVIDAEFEAAGVEPDPTSAPPAGRPASSPPVAEGDDDSAPVSLEDRQTVHALSSLAQPLPPPPPLTTATITAASTTLSSSSVSEVPLPSVSLMPPHAHSSAVSAMAPPPLFSPQPHHPTTTAIPNVTPTTTAAAAIPPPLDSQGSAGSSLPPTPLAGASASPFALASAPPPPLAAPAAPPATTTTHAPPPPTSSPSVSAPPTHSAAAAAAAEPEPVTLSPAVQGIKDVFDATLASHRGQGGSKVADIEKKLDAFYQRPSTLSAETIEVLVKIASSLRHGNSKQALQHYQSAASKLPLAEVPTMTAIKSLLSLASKKK